MATDHSESDGTPEGHDSDSDSDSDPTPPPADYHLPDDDTQPDEHGRLPRKCVWCERIPDAEYETVLTTNRALDNVHTRWYIEPVCAEHDVYDPLEKFDILYDYGGVRFVAEGVVAGVISAELAIDNLPDAEHAEFVRHLERKAGNS